MSGPKDIGDAGGIVGGTIEPITLAPDLRADTAAAVAEVARAIEAGDIEPTPAAVSRAFRETLHRTGSAPVDPFAERWQRISPEWLTTAPPPRRWLLTRRDTESRDPNDERNDIGVLPLGKVGMLVAAGGAGKTMVLAQLAVSVATGRPWLDGFAVPAESRGHVLLALGEEDAEEMRRRLYSVIRVLSTRGFTNAEMQAITDRIVVLPLAGVPVALVQGEGGEIRETDVLDALRTRLANERDAHGNPVEWRLLVLEPLSRWAGADTEKDNAAATRFVQAVETLVTVPGSPTVLLSHHTPKTSRGGEVNDATAARGATGLVDGVRWVANLDNDGPGGAVLSIPTKSNYSRADGHRVRLVRDHQHGGALRPATPEEIAKRVADREREEKEAAERKKARAGGSAAKKADTADDGDGWDV